MCSHAPVRFFNLEVKSKRIEILKRVYNDICYYVYIPICYIQDILFLDNIFQNFLVTS